MAFFGATIPNRTGRLIQRRLPKDGNRSLVIEIEPAEEPVSITDLKLFAKIDYDDEDDLLESFIKSVRIATEQHTGRSFVERTILMLMDYWPGRVVELPRPPLISITKVATLDEDDTETEYSSSNYYSINADPGKLILKKSVTEPINTSRDYGGFMVRYKAGYGSTKSTVPHSIREGIKMWASIVEATRKFDPKNPPPEALLYLDQYRTATMLIR